ncbi:MAG: hypothetical protein R2748_31550 [Bryobacterales bacterium]
MNPVRIILQLLSSPNAGPRVVAMTILTILAIAAIVGIVYGYHYWERKKKRRSRRRRHKAASQVERRELT